MDDATLAVREIQRHVEPIQNAGGSRKFKRDDLLARLIWVHNVALRVFWIRCRHGSVLLHGNESPFVLLLSKNYKNKVLYYFAPADTTILALNEASEPEIDSATLSPGPALMTKTTTTMTKTTTTNVHHHQSSGETLIRKRLLCA